MKVKDSRTEKKFDVFRVKNRKKSVKERVCVCVCERERERERESERECVCVCVGDGR